MFFVSGNIGQGGPRTTLKNLPGSFCALTVDVLEIDLDRLTLNLRVFGRLGHQNIVAEVIREWNTVVGPVETRCFRVKINERHGRASWALVIMLSEQDGTVWITSKESDFISAFGV